jgi:hypothetical protein
VEKQLTVISNTQHWSNPRSIAPIAEIEPPEAKSRPMMRAGTQWRTAIWTMDSLWLITTSHVTPLFARQVLQDGGESPKGRHHHGHVHRRHAAAMNAITTTSTFRPATAYVTVSCNTMATMAVVSVTSSSSNEGVTGVVLNAATYLFFSRTSGVGVTNSGLSSSSLDLSRSKPMQPHA